jgi:hypothetical protein
VHKTLISFHLYEGVSSVRLCLLKSDKGMSGSPTRSSPPSRKATPPEELAHTKSITFESIEKLKSEIDSLAAGNAKIRSNCDHLEQDLRTMASAFDRNMELLIATNRALERENSDMQEELDAKFSVIDQIEPLFESLRDVLPSDEVDVDALQAVVDTLPPLESRRKRRVTNSGLDPLVVDIMKAIPYFQDCESNQAFIAKIRRLLSDINRLSYLEISPAEDELRRKFDRLRAEQIKRQSQDSDRLKDLGRQRDDLLKKVEAFKTTAASPTPHRSTFSPSPRYTHGTPRKVELSPVKRVLKPAPVSPMAFSQANDLP